MGLHQKPRLLLQPRLLLHQKPRLLLPRLHTVLLIAHHTDVGLGATRHSLVCARWDLATLDTDRTDIADVHGDTAKINVLISVNTSGNIALNLIAIYQMFPSQ